jgi:hypothetical protein
MEEKSGSGDWRDEKPSLIQSQRHVLETGLYSDVVVKVGGREEEFIHCHRFVLISRSGVFATMLEERWRNYSESMKDSDDQRDVIDLTENPLVTAQAFRAFLRVRLPITNKCSFCKRVIFAIILMFCFSICIWMRLMRRARRLSCWTCWS